MAGHYSYKAACLDDSMTSPPGEYPLTNTPDVSFAESINPSNTTDWGNESTTSDEMVMCQQPRTSTAATTPMKREQVREYGCTRDVDILPCHSPIYCVSPVKSENYATMFHSNISQDSHQLLQRNSSDTSSHELLQRNSSDTSSHELLQRNSPDTSSHDLDNIVLAEKEYTAKFPGLRITDKNRTVFSSSQLQILKKSPVNNYQPESNNLSNYLDPEISRNFSPSFITDSYHGNNTDIVDDNNTNLFLKKYFANLNVSVKQNRSQPSSVNSQNLKPTRNSANKSASRVVKKKSKKSVFKKLKLVSRFTKFFSCGSGKSSPRRTITTV